MCKLLKQWSPSQSALELIRLNGITEEQIAKSLDYLRNQTEIADIDDVDGYDNWNAFFIMFCVKVSKTPVY